jgi:DNA repair ATPase RecN
MAVHVNIRNFQSIQEAKIVAEGFTILVGESSQGKSACLRAINAACNNKFKQGFLRYGADTIEIGISYDDNPNMLIVRKTKKESPTYELGELVFQKLNRTLPQEIEEFNNYGSIDSYEQKYPLNFFSQFSKPLLLEFSQKRILEILSSSKAFDDMNEASSKLNKKKEQNNGAFKQIASMISENKKQLSQYKENEELIHDDIEKMKIAMESTEKSENLILTADTLLNLISLQEKESKHLDALKKIKGLCEQIEGNNKQVHDIGSLWLAIGDSQAEEDTAKRLTKRISICEQYISSLKKKEALRIDLLEDLDNSMLQAKETSTRISSLKAKIGLLNEAVSKRQRIGTIETQRKDLDYILELMDIYRSVHSTIHSKQSMIDNHICPICGSKINV